VHLLVVSASPESKGIDQPGLPDLEWLAARASAGKHHSLTLQATPKYVQDIERRVPVKRYGSLLVDTHHFADEHGG
jgi:hypothetical protein